MKYFTLSFLFTLFISSGFSQSFHGTPDFIDSYGDRGEHPSMAFIDGNPAISYFHRIPSPYSDLYYIRATNPSGTSWSSPVGVATGSGAVGRYSSLTTIAGHPAISYHDLSNGKVVYIRAMDSLGSVWPNTAVYPDNYGSWHRKSGFYTCLRVIGGNPAISYYQEYDKDLRFVRAADSIGSSWGGAIVVDGTGDVGSHASMISAENRAAISYYDASNGNLKYVRASNASGTLWQTAIVVDTGGNVGEFTSLKIMDGNPAIAYYDRTNGNLKYVRANDPEGSSWGSPVIVDASSNDVGQFNSLNVWDGKPAISYYDATNGDLYLVVALTSTGSAWGSPMLIDDAGGMGSSLISLNSGNPAIAYYDGSNLKYVSGSVIFPVELLSFTAHMLADKVRLNWETATELNNDGFFIERSNDLENWDELGFVDGFGNSSERQSYSFEDLQPLSGKLYYRLRQVDFDGAYEYSSVAETYFVREKASLSFYPNPVKDLLYFQASASGHARIYDLLGNLVDELNLNHKRVWDLSHLASGLYPIRITSINGEVITGKIQLIK